MKSAIAILAVAAALAWAGPASAGSKSTLAVGGKTIGGPVDTTIAAGIVETLASQVPSVDGCVTLANTGNSAVDLTLAGGGSSTLQVASRKTSVFCRGSLQTVTATCLAQGSGSCSVSWRLDLAQ